MITVELSEVSFMPLSMFVLFLSCCLHTAISKSLYTTHIHYIPSSIHLTEGYTLEKERTFDMWLLNVRIKVQEQRNITEILSLFSVKDHRGKWSKFYCTFTVYGHGLVILCILVSQQEWT